jgi:4-hydroxybenzoate polyprenyltransferase
MRMMMGGFTDIRTGGWLDRVLPGWALPYAQLARLDRPIGWWLLLLPGWWSLALAAPDRPDLGLFFLFWLGAVVMRGAGCTLNDIVDRKYDGAVERTRGRPIPSGRVAVWQAVVFLVLQLAIGAAVLLSMNGLAVGLGVSILAIVAAYPFMKRITYWPQLFLGLNFNWGAMVAWTAVTGRVGWPAVLLYLAGVAWTLHYDTIYAHQDKADDIEIGVKSTALRFGARSKQWISGFALVTLAGIGLAFWIAGAGWPSFLALAVLAGHFGWQIATWKMDDQADCLAKFKSNRDAGLIILIGCLLASVH